VTLLSRRLAWQNEMRKSDRHVDVNVKILATFTVDPLVPYLGGALLDAGFTPSIQVGPFDQISQQLLAGDDLSTGDFVVVWPRLEDAWASGVLPLVAGDADAALASILGVGELCVERAGQLGVTIVVVLPAMPELRPLGVGDAGNPFGVGACASTIREALRSKVAGNPGVLVFDAEEVVRSIGSRHALDARRFAVAAVPYTEEAFAFAGERLARLISLQKRGSAKVAVVDADNTLWGGVVGEVGAMGVDLAEQGPGANYRQFQRFLVELGRAGMLTVLASKNNELDAFEVFDRGEMVLGKKDLSAWRVDWNPKSFNIESMAEELNLGTASMVFVDDSPVELAEVSARLPEVRVLQMPEDPAGWYGSIAESGAFDRLPPTVSDLGRTASYASEGLRKGALAAMDLSSFLASLQLRIEIFEPSPLDLPRLAQLIAKTNQFTLDGPRHSEATVMSMSSDPRAQLRLVSAVDRFGDYGVIGAFILTGSSSTSPEVVLDTFVLSCRAMGRGVEDGMLAAIGMLAAERTVTVAVVDGPKNQPMRAWIEGHLESGEGEVSTVSKTAWPPHLNQIAVSGSTQGNS
jgi:FkbH-like protein